MSNERKTTRKPTFFSLDDEAETRQAPDEPAATAGEDKDAHPSGADEPESVADRIRQARRNLPTTIEIAGRFAPESEDEGSADAAPGDFEPTPDIPPVSGASDERPALEPEPETAKPRKRRKPQVHEDLKLADEPVAEDEGASAAAADAALHQPRDQRQERSQRDEAQAPIDEDSADAATPGIPTLGDVRRGFRWSAIFISAVGALSMMAFTGWLASFIDDLVARQDWIGWLATGLTAIAMLALAVILLREMLAVMRLNRIGLLREHAERALKHDDRQQAEKVQRQITGMLQHRRSLSWGLAEMKEHQSEVLSAHDRLTLLERHLMTPLDSDARKIVANSAKRVSVMTAISPFVFLDMMLVAAENFRMLGRLMSLYGGRPGLFSQFKLIQLMIANLAMSGGIAVGADLLGHVMGRQVATRLAGRIGEGLVNGSLTARLGMTATKLIRPLPYIEAKPTSIASFVKELTKGARKND